MEELINFIEELNLPFEGEIHDKSYVITVTSSDSFSDLYNFVSNSSEFQIEDNSMAVENNAVFIFHNEEFELKFISDFLKDIYRLIITRR